MTAPHFIPVSTDQPKPDGRFCVFGTGASCNSHPVFVSLGPEGPRRSFELSRLLITPGGSFHQFFHVHSYLPGRPTLRHAVPRSCAAFRRGNQ